MSKPYSNYEENSQILEQNKTITDFISAKVYGYKTKHLLIEDEDKDSVEVIVNATLVNNDNNEKEIEQEDIKPEIDKSYKEEIDAFIKNTIKALNQEKESIVEENNSKNAEQSETHTSYDDNDTEENYEEDDFEPYDDDILVTDHIDDEWESYINGTISYRHANDNTMKIIESFISGKSVLDNRISKDKGYTAYFSLPKAEVTHHSIIFDGTQKGEYLNVKESLDMIVRFLNSISVKDVEVDIIQDGGKFNKIYHYTNTGNNDDVLSSVVCSKATLLFKDYE